MAILVGLSSDEIRIIVFSISVQLDQISLMMIKEKDLMKKVAYSAEFEKFNNLLNRLCESKIKLTD